MKYASVHCICVLLARIWASLVAQMVKNLPAMRKIQVQSLAKKGPLDKRMATHSSILAWKIPEQRSLVGCNPWGCKESDMTKRLKTYSSLGVVNTDIFVYITGKIYFLWITSFYKKF